MEVCWHDVVHRGPGDIAEDEDDPEGSQQDRLLLVLSVAAQSLSGVGSEQPLLEEVNTTTVDGEAVVKETQVWVTAPCIVPLFKGTTSDLVVGSDAVQGATLLSEFGMAVMPSAVADPELLSKLQVAADARIAAAEQAMAQRHPGIRLGTDLFAFTEFSSRGGQRFDLLFDEAEPASAPVFALSRTGPWLPAVRQRLGPQLSCMASVVYSRPGAEAQDWHTDGPHAGSSTTGAAAWVVPAPPDQAAYAVCVFLALLPLDHTVGFTQFWPGSHRYSGLVGFGAAAPLLGCAVDGLVGAGGCVLYDYRLMHRGMPNNSAGTQRPLLQLLYHSPAYTERKNYGTAHLFSGPAQNTHGVSNH